MGDESDANERECTEKTECEDCLGLTHRVCSRCGRRICRPCAKTHRMGPIVYADLPEEDQPPWCRRVTPAEKQAIDRLPLRERDVDADVTRRMLWWRLQRDRLVRWTVGGVLVPRDPAYKGRTLVRNCP